MYKEPLMIDKYEALQELYLKDPLKPLQVSALGLHFEQWLRAGEKGIDEVKLEGKGKRKREGEKKWKKELMVEEEDKVIDYQEIREGWGSREIEVTRASRLD